MGKYDRWNKLTKKWADKFNVKIIKKYPRKGCSHYFEMETSSSNGNFIGSFRCFAVNPDNTNGKDGSSVVMVSKQDGIGYVLLGNNIDKFLKEYKKKVLDAQVYLSLKYHNIIDKKKVKEIPLIENVKFLIKK